MPHPRRQRRGKTHGPLGVAEEQAREVQQQEVERRMIFVRHEREDPGEAAVGDGEEDPSRHSSQRRGFGRSGSVSASLKSSCWAAVEIARTAAFLIRRSTEMA
jgi:hypothetical protein